MYGIVLYNLPPKRMCGGLCFWFGCIAGSHCIMINSYPYNENDTERTKILVECNSRKRQEYINYLSHVVPFNSLHSMLVPLPTLYVFLVTAWYMPKYKRETEHLVAYIYGGLIYRALNLYPPLRLFVYTCVSPTLTPPPQTTNTTTTTFTLFTPSLRQIITVHIR
jgi:hypothetical protein